MSGSTSPTAPWIDATGIHAPVFADVLAYLQTQMQAIYGADIYLGNDSQDGQWIAIIAAAISDTNAACVAVYNAFSPSTAQGAGLSSVVKINGIAREAPSQGTVDLELVGQAGKTISNGVAQDQVGGNWLLPVSVTIPPSGLVTVTAIAQFAGALPAPAGTVTKIATPTLGWQSVTNPYPATPGAPVESDAALRRRQTISTALPSQTVLDGIVGAVANLPGVTQYKAFENDTNTTDANGLPPHSIAMVVQGGDAVAICQTILGKKTPGAYTHGTTRETVEDVYGLPHDVGFFRPTPVPIAVAISIHALPGYSSTIGDEITAAVAAYINGLAIGDDVLLSKLYMPANLCTDGAAAQPSDGTTYDITALLIAAKPAAPAAANVVISIIEIATCDPADITLTVA